MDDPFVCPKCGKESHHPEDKRQGYCAYCHAFTADPQPEDEEEEDAVLALCILWSPEPLAQRLVLVLPEEA